MKNYKSLFLIIVAFALLFVFFVKTSSAEIETNKKQTLTEKAYCFLYPSRCVDDLNVVSAIVATTTKVLETKEDKGIVTNVMSWIRSLKSNKIETKLLCVEDVCVNKGQFLKMVQNANNESQVFTVSFTTATTTIIK